ncbi:MAG: metal-dependent hydrolase [Desulfarculaceae bacterium]|nr:metal-dependent hydrolase [Desulfarculaceae bacterium]MCF8071335.1 metal-dependent hydrolase [Desulfarculaceae bacterium]MCF8101660.1 metal-dependent hydrolase [Desulfarculaceae bacterium]MCF8116731.1 metal-dependent hydrolase [Desulfarculaceae bacterium]
MSSVVGHGLAGLAVYQALKRPCRLPGKTPGVLLALGLSLLPDLDVAALALWPGVFHHRGFTHSLVFALLAGGVAAVAVAWRRWENLPRAWLGLSLVAASHPLLDYLMGCGPGVPWLWPLSGEGFLSPVQVVPTAYYSRTLGGLWGLLSHGPTLRGMAQEAAIFLPLLGLAWWLGRGSKRKGEA